MTKILHEILALAEIDGRLMDLKRRLEAGPKEIQQLQASIEQARAERRTRSETVKDQAAEVDACNLEIRTAEAEIEDQERKLKHVKSNKEYKVITQRLKELKEAIVRHESRCLEVMEELDKLKDDMQQRQQNIEQTEERIELLKVEIAEEAKEIRAQAQELKEQRQEQIRRVEEIDPNALETYKMAFRRGHGVAVTEMREGACQSCFRRANANLEGCVILGRDMRSCVCAGCGRILYLKAVVEG